MKRVLTCFENLMNKGHNVNISWCCSDGRFRLGDEIINVNGKSLRGLTMDEAKAVLSSNGSQVSCSSYRTKKESCKC